MAMDPRFLTHYALIGRELKFMGFAVENMARDELYAVIGFLLDQVDDEPKGELRQEAPLGAPFSDPPPNNGLVEG
jgi:hypothetical protein